jgi:hypothetical protein
LRCLHPGIKPCVCGIWMPALLPVVSLATPTMFYPSPSRRTTVKSYRLPVIRPLNCGTRWVNVNSILPRTVIASGSRAFVSRPTPRTRWLSAVAGIVWSR